MKIKSMVKIKEEVSKTPMTADRKTVLSSIYSNSELQNSDFFSSFYILYILVQGERDKGVGG